MRITVQGSYTLNDLANNYYNSECTCILVHTCTCACTCACTCTCTIAGACAGVECMTLSMWVMNHYHMHNDM